MTKMHRGHKYEYIDAVGEDGSWIHSPACQCQKERERTKAEWKRIDEALP